MLTILIFYDVLWYNVNILTRDLWVGIARVPEMFVVRDLLCPVQIG